MLFKNISLILTQLINDLHHTLFCRCIFNWSSIFLFTINGILNHNRVESISIKNNRPQTTAPLHTTFQIETPIRHLNWRILGITMTKNLICIIRHHLIESSSYFKIITISTNTTNHLFRSNLSQIIRNKTQTSMSNQNSLFTKFIIHTLIKFTIQHSSNLRIQPPSFKLSPCHILKFFRL